MYSVHCKNYPHRDIPARTANLLNQSSFLRTSNVVVIHSTVKLFLGFRDMHIGYARVSTVDQNPVLQIRAFKQDR